MWASAPTISRLFEIYPAGLFLQHSLDQLRNVSTRRPPCGWPHGAPKRLFHLLGRTKFARHQGFARRAKRLYARCAPRGGVRISPQINAAGLLLQHGLDQLRNVRARLHRGGTLAVDVGDHRALGLRYADVGLVGQVG